MKTIKQTVGEDEEQGKAVDPWLAKDKENREKIKNGTMTIEEWLRLPSKGF